MEERIRILQDKEENKNKPLIFRKNLNPINSGLNKRDATKMLDNYTYKNNKNKFLIRYTRPLSRKPGDWNLPDYQQFCNEIRRADGVLINARAIFRKGVIPGIKDKVIQPNEKILNSSRDDRINHLNEHFKKAEIYIEKVKNKAKNEKNIMGRKANNKTINERLVMGLKRLSIMEKELDKEVTNEILIKK